MEGSSKGAARSEALQFWLEWVQRLRLTSRVTCTDPRYASAFRFDERDSPAPGSAPPDGLAGGCSAADGVLEACAGWFAYQMYVLDNAEKAAIVHLVIENATAAYRQRAAPGRTGAGEEDSAPQNVEGAVQRAALVGALLQNESPHGYGRLKEVVGEAWDTIEAMTDRMAALTSSDPPPPFLVPLSTSPPLSRSVGS